MPGVFKYAFLLYCLTCFVGCVTQKAANKIEEKAVQDYVNTHPCTNDTLIFSGTTDTVATFDTIYVEQEPDVSQSNIPSQQYVVIDNAKAEVKPQIKYIVKTQTIHDSIKYYVTDRRMIGILQDSIGFYKTDNNYLRNQATQADARATKYSTWFWCLVIGIILLIAAAIYVHFKYGFLKGVHI